MTKSLPMALFYGIRNFEYAYGYRKTGQIYFAEYFPDALETLYAVKTASLYLSLRAGEDFIHGDPQCGRLRTSGSHSGGDRHPGRL